MDDLISRKNILEVLDTYPKFGADERFRLVAWREGLMPYIQLEDVVKAIVGVPSVQPETCEGCKHLGKWENEVEYGYPAPCTCCKRRVGDNYER